MKKLNTQKLKKLVSTLIWRDKKNFLGLSVSIDMNLIKSEEDIEDILTDAVKTLKFMAAKEWRGFKKQS